MSDQQDDPAASGPNPRPARRRTNRQGTARGVGGGVLIGAQVVAGLLSLAIVLGTGWAWAEYRSFQGNIVQTDALPAASGPSGTDAAPAADDGKDQNIVLVGTDDRSNLTAEQLQELGTEQDGGSVLTDTMMILHVPADGSKATLISFPRDSWVSIPGYGHSKLNAAYGYGSDNGQDPDAGRQLLVETLQNLTGLSIDHYVEVSLYGFYTIANAIDGVQINLCEDQQDPYSGIDLKKGTQRVTGTQALAFVRQRHGLDAYGGDIARERRQQYFLSQVFKQIQSAGTLLNPLKLQSLLSAVSGSLTMDDPGFAIEFAKQMSGLSAGNITLSVIPVLDPNAREGDQDVVALDFDAIPSFIAQVIGSTDPALSAAAVAAGSFAVDVLNGSGASGAAAANAAALHVLGFSAAAVGDAGSRTASTIIQYANGMQGQAKTLAAQVPGAVLVEDSNVTTLTLVLGTNDVQVTGIAPPGGTGSAGPGATPTPAPATPTPSTPAPGAPAPGQTTAASTDPPVASGADP
jgi:LCP family protein required for cell wall assembly